MITTKNQIKNLAPLIVECTDCSSPEASVKFQNGVCLCEDCHLDLIGLNPQRLEDLGPRVNLIVESVPLKIAA